MNVRAALALVLLTTTTSAFADDSDDTLAFYLAKSDVVIRGKIMNEPTGISDEAGVVHCLCAVEVIDEVYNPGWNFGKRVAVEVIRFEMGDADRHPLVKKDRECLLFLKRKPRCESPDWQTADFWFGVQRPTPRKIQAIKRLGERTVKPVKLEPVSKVPTYEPEQCREFIESRLAVLVGESPFDNQGLGCEVYRYKPSKNRTLLFFTRGGKLTGEYRDEVRSENFFFRTDAYFLSTASREDFSDSEKQPLRFIRKTHDLVEVRHHYMHSKVHWASYVHNRQAVAGMPQEETTEELVRRHYRIGCREEMLRSDKKYRFILYRPNPTGFETEVSNQYFKGKGVLLEDRNIPEYYIYSDIDFVKDAPKLLIELHEELSADQYDATLYKRPKTKLLATMTCGTEELADENIEFRADE